MRALLTGLLLVLTAGVAGCGIDTACIQHGSDASYDRCANGHEWLWPSCEEDEDQCEEEEEEYPLRCDEYRHGTSCDDEGFPYECDGIWRRLNEPCG